MPVPIPTVRSFIPPFINLPFSLPNCTAVAITEPLLNHLLPFLRYSFLLPQIPPHCYYFLTPQYPMVLP